MAVHVGEIHTELSPRSPVPTDSASESSEPRYPGAREDQWRTSHARIAQLSRRVATEDSDD